MIEINAIGDECPIPVIKAKNALKNMKIGESLVISVDNVIATQNLKKLAEETGCDYLLEGEEDNFNITITRNSYKSAVAEEKDFVVAISSDKMGSGNDELGSVLIKGFIYALTELETPPSCIIFYNGGAKLTVKDSSSIEDLEKLANKGCEILTCGTCLNYYHLEDSLAIGGVSNMYTIAQKLSSASKVIKP